MPADSQKVSRSSAFFSSLLCEMARRLRYVPPEGGLFEVTTRTVQGRFLLKPSHEFNTIILGVMGPAQRLYPIQIPAFVVLSNHYHMLLSVDTAQHLVAFMGYFNGNLGKEIIRHVDGWSNPAWSRRYQAIWIPPNEYEQIGRLHYLLSNGAKDGLVASPRQWPGVLGGLQPLRCRVPRSRRETQSRRPVSSLSRRLLPAAAALQGRLRPRLTTLRPDSHCNLPPFLTPLTPAGAEGCSQSPHSP